MSIFDGKRLDKEVFLLDSTGLRNGWYTDAYFLNTVKILETLSEEGYVFSGKGDLAESVCSTVLNGDLVVEMQIFTRRKPFSLVTGVDEALAILEEGTGYHDDNGLFINTYEDLEVEAIHDGSFALYNGDPMAVQPVMKIRGRYRDFARLETPMLGVLTEATRIATNSYHVLAAARGKDVLFFPARFAHYKLQPMHGYAYNLAVQAINRDYNRKSRTFISTGSQGAWWAGKGGGTIAHASIACFLGDTAETMMQFARIIPAEVPRIALVDYHNDCVGETLKVMERMFAEYWRLYAAGQTEESDRYRLFAVRVDTSGNMRDVSLPALGDHRLDCGVNPRLVKLLRKAIDEAWVTWKISDDAAEAAAYWCREVKIVATGGFDAGRITEFEAAGVPVDIYGVGSCLLENSGGSGTKNDYTADIVRVYIDGKWYNLSKTGRQACENPQLEQVR